MACKVGSLLLMSGKIFHFSTKKALIPGFQMLKITARTLILWLFILARETSYWVFVRAEWE
ncbi:hypothetical protein P368_11000 [Comamonas thiooxydans]|nr:hypothetical protein P365_12815 [Comamonas thiooxydans]KGH12800.1 hypothetical protein P368_11000 [Comamonas thiooxydans]